MKFIFTVCLLCCTVLCSVAQTGNRQPWLNIGVDLGMPLGDYKDVYGTGYGASLKCEVPVSNSTFFTITAGYERFGYSSKFKNFYNPANSGVGYVPLKGGFKSYAGSFFAEGQIGIAVSTLSGAGTAFAYSPGVGYAVAKGVEAGVRYESWSKDGAFNQVAFRLGIRLQ